MDRETLRKFEERGLKCPFTSTKSGEIFVAESGESLKMEIHQLATVIFETIGAVGDIKVDRIEVQGERKGLVIALDNDSMAGSIYNQKEAGKLDDYWTLVEELQTQPVVVREVEVKPRPVVEEKVVEKPVEKPVEQPIEKPVEKPKEKPKIKLDANVINKMKEKSKEYLGDFTERIFQNQIKAQRIKIEEFYDEDARRLVFALGKAAGMIIGPSKGRDMTNKLLELLK